MCRPFTLSVPFGSRELRDGDVLCRKTMSKFRFKLCTIIMELLFYSRLSLLTSYITSPLTDPNPPYQSLCDYVMRKGIVYEKLIKPSLDKIVNISKLSLRYLIPSFVTSIIFVTSLWDIPISVYRLYTKVHLVCFISYRTCQKMKDYFAYIRI